jgi:hypothetical protein
MHQHGLIAMIMPDGKTGGAAPGEGPKTVAHTVADRLQRLEPGAIADSMDTQTLKHCDGGWQ